MKLIDGEKLLQWLDAAYGKETLPYLYPELKSYVESGEFDPSPTNETKPLCHNCRHGHIYCGECDLDAYERFHAPEPTGVPPILSKMTYNDQFQLRMLVREFGAEHISDVANHFEKSI